MNFGVLFFILIALFMFGSVFTLKVFDKPKSKDKGGMNKKDKSSQEQ